MKGLRRFTRLWNPSFSAAFLTVLSDTSKVLRKEVPRLLGVRLDAADELSGVSISASISERWRATRSRKGIIGIMLALSLEGVANG